ncbi:hypothetical protein AB0K49_24195 [Streptomyces decoyicus]|uniref:hypothetical protein n=1 Tax=Streptomyces decoyicus TaxID=249567 RepID=UPI00345C8B8B
MGATLHIDIWIEWIAMEIEWIAPGSGATAVRLMLWSAAPVRRAVAGAPSAAVAVAVERSLVIGAPPTVSAPSRHRSCLGECGRCPGPGGTVATHVPTAPVHSPAARLSSRTVISRSAERDRAP